MEAFGPEHDTGQAVARFAYNATSSRWYDRDGKLWSHVDYSKGKVHGSALHATEKGARGYAAQFDAGERDGWQVFTQGFALVTSFKEGKPITTYELRDGKVVGRWPHADVGPPNAGIKARFDDSERAYQEFRKAEAKMRRDVRDWIRDYRRLIAGQLSRVRRARTTAKYNARQDAIATGLIQQMLTQRNANPLLE